MAVLWLSQVHVCLFFFFFFFFLQSSLSENTDRLKRKLLMSLLSNEKGKTGRNNCMKGINYTQIQNTPPTQKKKKKKAKD